MEMKIAKPLSTPAPSKGNETFLSPWGELFIFIQQNVWSSFKSFPIKIFLFAFRFRFSSEDFETFPCFDTRETSLSYSIYSSFEINDGGQIFSMSVQQECRPDFLTDYTRLLGNLSREQKERLLTWFLYVCSFFHEPPQPGEKRVRTRDMCHGVRNVEFSTLRHSIYSIRREHK